MGPKSPRVVGHRINIPEWWWDEFDKVTANMSASEMTERINAESPDGRKYTEWNVYRFKDRKSATLELAMAFVAAFKSLPPPMIVARSLKQAQGFWSIIQADDPQPSTSKDHGSVPNLPETIEDTGDFGSDLDQDTKHTPRSSSPRKRR